MGQVLVIRGKPCAATAAGVPVLRLAAQMALLETEALSEISGAGSEGRPRVTLAVNADSMSAWFTAVFDNLPDVLLDIRIEDQDHSARMLREGAVMGAVTTERAPVPGCRVESLGVMRYVPVATATYIERNLPDGFTADVAATAASLAWNRADALQDMLVRKVFRRTIARPVHYVPTAEGYRAAVLAGLGWAMHPEQSVDPSFTQISRHHLDIPLNWQCWKMTSPTLTAVTDAVRSAAAEQLRRRGA